MRTKHLTGAAIIAIGIGIALPLTWPAFCAVLSLGTGLM
jgi:hypothetical protein